MAIYDPTGNKVNLNENPPKKYSVQGFELETGTTHIDCFQNARAAAQQLVQQASAKTGFVPKITNPFQLEPAAMGVFLCLALEIQERDSKIDALESRLSRLEAAHDDSGSAEG